MVQSSFNLGGEDEEIRSGMPCGEELRTFEASEQMCVFIREEAGKGFNGRQGELGGQR